MPFTRQELVPRPRLLEQMSRGLSCPLTLITAPAGFGKTTLAASCAAACEMPVAWLSLDKNDNQEGRFLTYLTAALQTADSRIGVEAASLMSGIQQASPEAVLTSLINDIAAAAIEIALVLDDYQVINSQAVHQAMTFLLEYLPAALHLVIASRSDPPLPLSRLRARAQTVELRAADLRFSTHETAVFLNDVMGLHLDAASVALLEERTEGWIAGLQMAALSMRDRKDIDGFIRGFSGSNRYILDYLLEEVMAKQPPEMQRFLLRTSILERLSAPLCDDLLAGLESTEPAAPDGDFHSVLPSDPRSDLFLKQLERENLFLVSLDDERLWYRYHHLFADLLKVRLQQSQPELVPRLHMRASAWLEKNGFIAEAIQHLFAADEMNRALDLLEHHAPVRWQQSDVSVMQMADSLPLELLLTRPKIGIYQAWLLIIKGRIEKALPLLDCMQRQCMDVSPAAERQWVCLMVRLALVFLSPASENGSRRLLPDESELQQIPADEPVMRDAAEILYGMTLSRRGENEYAIAFAERCLRQEKMPHAALQMPSLVPFLAAVYCDQGRLHAAAALCRKYLDIIKEQGTHISTAGSMDIILGEVLYEWNCLEEAAEHLRHGLRANEPWGNVIMDAYGMSSLAKLLQAKGDSNGAMHMAGQFERRLKGGKSLPVEFAEDFYTLRVCLQLAGGDISGTSRWAEQVQRSHDFHLHPQYYRLTLARVYLAQGRYAAVEEMLQAVPQQYAAGCRYTWHIESKLLLAAAAAGQQRLAQAFEHIEACLCRAETEGYLRAFLDPGEAVRDLLSAYIRSVGGSHKQYAGILLDAFSPSGATGAAASQPAGLVEPLSERELEVLHLMAQGKTNQQIAGQLVVARGTIKAHAASIYRKLESGNRTEAVANARRLGIIP